MQKCSACKKAVATVHVMDLQDGSVVSSSYLCETCAENEGVVQTKPSTIKFSTEILENLLGGLKGTEGQLTKESVVGLTPGDTVCPGCQMTAAEFKVRGRLGCPRCYEVFRAAIIPLLERVHDATTHRGRFPGRSAKAVPVPVNQAELRRKLGNAIKDEHYEEAARLRDQIKQSETKKAEGEG